MAFRNKELASRAGKLSTRKGVPNRTTQQVRKAFQLLIDDKLLREILTMAKQSLASYLTEPKMHFQNKNLQGLKKSAHKLKGVAFSLFFERLAASAISLEKITSFEENDISKLLTELETEIEYLVSILSTDYNI